MAVVSAGPYAPRPRQITTPAVQHPTTQFFTGRMPFLLPNQQCHSTEGNLVSQEVNHNHFKKTPCESLAADSMNEDDDIPFWPLLS